MHGCACAYAVPFEPIPLLISFYRKWWNSGTDSRNALRWNGSQRSAFCSAAFRPEQSGTGPVRPSRRSQFATATLCSLHTQQLPCWCRVGPTSNGGHRWRGYVWPCLIAGSEARSYRWGSLVGPFLLRYASKVSQRWLSNTRHKNHARAPGCCVHLRTRCRPAHPVRHCERH
jgi:hypothetical protein